MSKLQLTIMNPKKTWYVVKFNDVKIGDFIMIEDGTFHYDPKPFNNGYFPSWILKELHDELEKLNKNSPVNQYHEHMKTEINADYEKIMDLLSKSEGFKREIIDLENTLVESIKSFTSLSNFIKNTNSFSFDETENIFNVIHTAKETVAEKIEAAITARKLDVINIFNLNQKEE